MRPPSRMAQINSPPSSQMSSRPLPPPCWMLLVATSQAARTRSSLRRESSPAKRAHWPTRWRTIARSALPKSSVTAGRPGSQSSPARAGADGMAALGSEQDLVAEAAGVVWAHHRQCPLLGEGEVEEALVQLALFHL